MDTVTGQVAKVPVRASLAYFDPGCGSGERAVVTQARGAETASGRQAATRLVSLDAGAGKVTELVELAGQVTSAVPAAGESVVAAAGRRLVAVDRRGRVRGLAGASSVPFRLTVDAVGGVVYMEHAEGVGHVRRLTVARPSSVTELARGPLTGLNILPGGAQRVFITGQAQLTAPLPAPVRRVDAPATAEISTDGQLALLRGPRPSPGPDGSGMGSPSRAWTTAMTDTSSAARAGRPSCV